MELHLNLSTLFRVVVVEGVLAARPGFTTAAVHAVGRRGAEERGMKLLDLVRRNHWLMSDREAWEAKVRSRVFFFSVIHAQASSKSLEDQRHHLFFYLTDNTSFALVQVYCKTSFMILGNMPVRCNGREKSERDTN
jgi:hypothetical protein